MFDRLVMTTATDARKSALAPYETHATAYDDGHPVATLTRPRLYGNSCPGMAEGRGLFRLATTDGQLVATFARVPTLAFVRRELAAFARSGAGLADMTAAELAAEERDALAREAVNMETARAASFDTFRASAINRAIRAARRAELAAELAPVTLAPAEVAAVTAAAMRASVPALKSAGRSLARRIATATGREAGELAARARIVAHVAELKARAIPGELAAAFALNVRPAEYRAPMTADIEDSELTAREPGRAWVFKAGATAATVALAFASPASAEIAAGHFIPAAGTLDSAIEAARVYLVASPVILFTLCVAGAAAFATWASK